ncbi:MAG: hypothetical protein FJY86_04095 [Candidatus Diapherotrites archaeon]|uniref:Uncharacterized protein n=1 Tax=Candidatus Iainarchaeum sp. TaxID=3101447 RepID=A0A8T4C931_9ARCH|nr:hypothetical protein [Candidatus Diapherotrites archaeon]
MGTVADFFKGFIKSTKIIAQKVGAFVMLVFFLGVLMGTYIAFAGLSLLWVAAFGLVVVVFWNDFGEGVGILLLLLIVFFFMPYLLPQIRI